MTYIVISNNETDSEFLIELIEADSYAEAKQKSAENADRRKVSQRHVCSIAVPKGYRAVLTAEDTDNTCIADYWRRFFEEQREG